jgi:hypothetical protein
MSKTQTNQSNKDDSQSDFQLVNLEELFATSSPSDFLVKDTKKESDFYNPMPALSQNKKSYVSRIKFIPFIPNPKISILSKWVIYLQNSELGNKYIDCPSSIDQPSILQQLYFALKYSENAIESKLAENFSRRRVYFSLVQIVSDDNRPELVGKIKIFKYGQKLYNRLDKLMNPKRESRVEPHNPFDIFNGRAFDLDVKIKAGYNDYEDCEFSINSEPFQIDGEVIKRNKENYEKVANWILENSPDLLQVQYKSWDDDTLQYVLSTIESTVSNRKMIEQIYRKNNINLNFKTKLKKNTVDVETEEIEEDDEVETIREKKDTIYNKIKSTRSKYNEIDEDDEIDEDEDEIEEIMKTSKKSQSENKKSKVKQTVEEEDELDIDDLYKGL